jgi:hypothetical protein
MMVPCWNLERSVAQTGACFRLSMEFHVHAEADDIVGYPNYSQVNVFVAVESKASCWGLRRSMTQTGAPVHHSLDLRAEIDGHPKYAPEQALAAAQLKVPC